VVFTPLVQELSPDLSSDLSYAPATRSELSPPCAWPSSARECASAGSAKESVRCNLLVVCVGPNQGGSTATDPLVHHGRHFGRTIHALCRVHTLLINGILRDVENDSEEPFTNEYIPLLFFNLTYLRNLIGKKGSTAYTSNSSSWFQASRSVCLMGPRKRFFTLQTWFVFYSR
jgi:hypothetical protein